MQSSISNEFDLALSSGAISLVHTSSAPGYIRKKECRRISHYSGRFGIGYTVEYPNVSGFTSRFGKFVKSHNFHKIEYYCLK